MNLGWLPWKRDEVEQLQRLALCVRQQVDPSARACRAELLRMSKGIEKVFFDQDRHSYVIHYATDTLAWKAGAASSASQ
jgi:hypothetical protein